MLCLTICQKRKLLRYVSILIMSGVLFLLLASLFGFDYIKPLLERLDFLSWETNDYGATNTRKDSISIMIYYIKQHPWTGNGSGSMNYVSSNEKLLYKLGYYYSINAGRGNANLFLATLFDVGIFGFIPFVIFLILLFSKTIKSFWLLKESRHLKKKANYYLSLIIVFFSIIVDFQFNNGIRFSSIWILFGLLEKSGFSSLQFDQKSFPRTALLFSK